MSAKHVLTNQMVPMLIWRPSSQAIPKDTQAAQRLAAPAADALDDHFARFFAIFAEK